MGRIGQFLPLQNGRVWWAVVNTHSWTIRGCVSDEGKPGGACPGSFLGEQFWGFQMKRGKNPALRKLGAEAAPWASPGDQAEEQTPLSQLLPWTALDPPSWLRHTL